VAAALADCQSYLRGIVHLGSLYYHEEVGVALGLIFGQEVI